jgi:hypothetical protein
MEPDQEDAIITRYNEFRDSEFTRLKKLKKKGLVHIVNRKVKEHGTRYAISGLSVERLCELIFDCDLNFFAARLENDFDAEQEMFLCRVWEGGEALNLNLKSTLVKIDDHDITVEICQTIAPGYILHTAVMDALQHLYSERDERLCDAHKTVNEKKQGYVERRRTLYLKTDVTNVLFSNDLSISQALSRPCIQILIHNVTLSDHYRVIFPFFWALKSEWMVIILCLDSHEMHYIFTKYNCPNTSASTSDERESFVLFAQERLQELVKLLISIESIPIVHDVAINVTAVSTNANDITANAIAEPINWKIVFYDPHKQCPAASNRTHRNMEGAVDKQEDSGIYIAYAIECDYFDAPIYAISTDWAIIRRRFSYWIVNAQVPH